MRETTATASSERQAKQTIALNGNMNRKLALSDKQISRECDEGAPSEGSPKLRPSEAL